MTLTPILGYFLDFFCQNLPLGVDIRAQDSAGISTLPIRVGRFRNLVGVKRGIGLGT